MSFTDGKPRVATEHDCKARWGGDRPGKRFRCGMCGHKFKPGDVWRFLYTNGLGAVHVDGALIAKYGGNPLICEACDGPDVIERWKEKCDEMYDEKNWWFIQ